jgi:hypothetical protein
MTVLEQQHSLLFETLSSDLTLAFSDLVNRLLSQKEAAGESSING